MFRRILIALAAALTAIGLAQQPLKPPTYFLSTAPELLDGVTVDGQLTVASGQNFKDGSRLDVYVLRSTGDETVEVLVQSDDFDTYLTLVAPDGTVLDANDEVSLPDAWYTSRVRTYLADPGYYLVVVSGYRAEDVGRYTVTRSVYVPPPQVAVEATVPGSYAGTLSAGAADSYFLTVDTPVTVEVVLRSDAFDTYLEAFDGDGNWLDANDDFDGTNSRLVLELQPGRTELLVSAYWEEGEGPYTIKIDSYVRPPEVRVQVAAPGSFDGFLAAEAIDVYELTLVAPATVTVTLRSDAFDAYLELYDADGYWIDANDDFDGTDSRLTLDLAAGTYVVEASALFAGEGGPYTIDLDW